jgi:hypothetical protein
VSVRQIDTCRGDSCDQITEIKNNEDCYCASFVNSFFAAGLRPAAEGKKGPGNGN